MTSSIRGRLATIVALLSLTPTAYAGGETRGWLARDFGPLLRDFHSLATSRGSLATLGLGGGAALAVHRYDDDVLFGDSRAAEEIFEPGGIGGGGYVQVGGAIAAYSIGRLASADGLGDLGRDLIRAQILTSTLTFGVKLSARRLRPNGKDYYSLPSGHSAASFATATILTRRWGPAAAVPAYLAAAYIAASRVQQRHHYLSDVVLGAGFGVASGLSIGMADRRVALTPIAVHGGVGIGVTIATHNSARSSK